MKGMVIICTYLNKDIKMETEVAIIAGGCFWGIEELFRKQKGVIDTEVGYIGGSNNNPTYKNHPGHAEAVRIEFSPRVISYRKLLEYFFQIHNPTTINRQGNDIGSSYRSVIFFTSESQKMEAEKLIKEINASNNWPGIVVTEVISAGTFWPAEKEHQDYLQNHPNGYTCHFERPDWKLI